jgi:Fic-DOC domain mobile mystery protein B
LRLSWVSTRADLNEAEADNILKGRQKWRARARARGARQLTLGQLLDHMTLREVHRDMFGDVWSWAGQFRHRDLTIGIEFWRVPEAISNLLADAYFWVGGDQPMPLPKAACRFHHKLVEIHPFPNGNGRHAREMTHLLLLVQGGKPFTWGSENLNEVNEVRGRYIDALVMADGGDYSHLEDFLLGSGRASRVKDE